jgi:hypothetical protein
MSDNKVIHSEVDIYVATSSGYRSREEFGSRLNNSDALKEGIREIARLLTINGEGDEAVRLVAEAKAAVEEFMKGKAA